MPSTYKTPKIYPGFSQAKQEVWDYLAAQAPYEDEFEVNQTKLAGILDYSRATIQHALKTFISANLLEKTRERKGRGNGSIFRFLWSFIPENETPSRTHSVRLSPMKNITKDSPGYRYFAMKFRKSIEKSTDLAPHQGGVVGKLLKILDGKERHTWKSTLIFLRRKVDEGLDLTGFFVWLSKYLSPKIRKQRENEKTKQAIREAKEEHRQEIEQKSEDPPKRSDYDSWEAYNQAYEDFMES